MFFRNRQTPPSPQCKHIRALGRMPKVSLEIFADLGLTDAEIGRYFMVPQHCIRNLRKLFYRDG